MDYEIVTDSSANLTDEIIEKYGIHIISLTFMLDGKESFSFIKGEKTDLKQFYDTLRKGAKITTSQINIQLCKEVVEGILKEGKDVFYIGFSSALSGAFSAAEMVLKELSQEYHLGRYIVSIPFPPQWEKGF